MGDHNQVDSELILLSHRNDQRRSVELIQQSPRVILRCSRRLLSNGSPEQAVRASRALVLGTEFAERDARARLTRTLGYNGFSSNSSRHPVRARSAVPGD